MDRNADSLPKSSVSPVQIVRDTIAAATFTRAEELGGGVNSSVKLINGGTVVFKPAAGETEQELRPGIAPGTQWQREIAASIVDEELETNLVPATTELTYNGEVGSAQVFRDGFQTADQLWDQGEVDLPSDIIKQLTLRQRRDWHLLDEIIGNTDRHPGNRMARRKGTGWEIALIDNGLCLSTRGFTSMRATPAGGLKLDNQSRRNIEKFLLREPDVRRKIEALIETRALDAMFKRARALLASGVFSSE